MKIHFSVDVYERLGAERCDEIAAAFEKQYQAEGKSEMQVESVRADVKSDGLHVSCGEHRLEESL